jgi:hypothetical protein
VQYEQIFKESLYRTPARVAGAILNPMVATKIPWVLIGAVGLFALRFVYRSGVDINWDLRNYHYFFGYSLLHWRFDTDIAPAGMNSFYNPIPLAMFYLMLSLLPFPAYAWIIAALQLSSLPIVVLICREIDRELGHETSSPAAWLALCLCLAAPLWWSELGTTFYSSTTAPLVLLSLLFVLRGIRTASGAQPAHIPFALAGAALGFACGLKLTNGIFAVGLLLALAMALFPLRPGIAARHLCIYVMGLVAGFAPTSWWNIFLFRRWSNPLFPYYNAIFRSPYYPAIDFRDPRFKFHSLPEFVNFLFAATRDTRKTLELEFADARLLMFVILMLFVLAAWVLKRLVSGKVVVGNSPTEVTAAFLWFFSSSFVLWVVMFAYQRYLIPIELLFGIAIWILVAQIVRGQLHIVATMTIFLIVSLTTVMSPDWGHWHGERDRHSFVKIEVPNEIASTPADYLVYGEPLTYVLPSLNADSRFFGIRFRPQIDPRLDKMVAAALAADRTRPIRLLTFDDNLAEASAQVASMGLTTEPVCWPVRTDIDRLIVCKVNR